MKPMKKGQEEIVGFVVIVILIAIVMLIFLAFNLHSTPETRESVTVQQFLASSLEYTTDCSLRTQEHARVKELFNECREGSTCVDQRSACQILNETLPLLIKQGLNIGQDRPLVGYNFSSSYWPYNGSIERMPILAFSYGNCTSGRTLRGASELQPSEGGTIHTTLEVCS